MGLLTRDEIIGQMTTQLELTKEESGLYLLLVSRGSMAIPEISKSLSISEGDVKLAGGSLLAKGLIIEKPGTVQGYSALHPRMALSNVFKTFEADTIKKIREKRAVVDRLSAALIPIFEERKAA